MVRNEMMYGTLKLEQKKTIFRTNMKTPNDVNGDSGAFSAHYHGPEDIFSNFLTISLLVSPTIPLL